MGEKTNKLFLSSEEELKEIKSNLQSNCSIMIKNLTGEEYKNLISTIQSYWSGEDADQWIKDLTSNISVIATNIKKVSNKAQSALDLNLKELK